MRKACVLAWLLVSGCGRVGFEAASTAGDGADGGGTTGDGLSALSCASLAPTCGPTGTAPCCESPMVTGGTFYRSYDGTGNNNMGFPATVSTFRLDKYEVTVGRFRTFVNEGYGTQQKPPAANAGARTLNGMANQGGWDTAWNTNLPTDTATLVAAVKCSASFQAWTNTPAGNENRPMNCINWYEAMAFCVWDGGFLPTEAEWNYAASGGSLQRSYPWSNPPSNLTIDDSTYASYWVDATKQCMGDRMNGCALTDMVPVGSKPAGDGAWGQSDLGGNVWEWTLDWYQDTYPTPCNDCANLTETPTRAVRSSGYSVGASNLRGAHRYFNSPTDIGGDLGVRCARTP